MKLFNNLERKHYSLLAGWLLINVLQSIFTNLHADESYYWLYSKHLAWGFFDHPPMIAFMIHLGDLISHSELGVRLFVVLLSGLTMAMIMNELNEKKDLVFLSVFMLSFPLVHTHIGGFLALPDTPLVFFTLLFYLAYRRFSEKPNLKLALLLAVVAAAMIYSKYHAFLVLGLIVLSNLKLLKNKYFWVILAGALVLLLPHVLWQFDNHFPTFKYHLHDRSKPFQLKYFFDNILNQLIMAGPLTGVLVFYSLRKFRAGQDPFKRAVLFSIVGFYALFFILSFWNRIEAHWTTAITPLLMIASYPVISTNPVTKKWFKRLALPVVVLFFVFRFYMAADFIPNKGGLKLGFYNRGATSKQIQDLAGGRKVAFFDNFASPGMYEFYTGDPAVLLSTPGYRYCQFDLWDDEAYGEGDSLFVVIPDRMEATNLIRLANGKRITSVITPQFQSLKKLDLEIEDLQAKGDALVVSVKLINHSAKIILLKHPSQPAIGYMKDNRDVERSTLYQLTSKEELLPEEQLVFKYEIPIVDIDPEKQIIIYLQTIERNRGEMIAISKEQVAKLLNHQE